MAKKCKGWIGWLILIVGILFLLVDFGIWNFFGISWYSAAFVLIGLGGLFHHK
jgi:hypothetical protein